MKRRSPPKRTRSPAALSYETVDGSYRLEDGKTDGFYVTKPLDGRTVDGAALTADLAAAAGGGDT